MVKKILTNEVEVPKGFEEGDTPEDIMQKILLSGEKPHDHTYAWVTQFIKDTFTNDIERLLKQGWSLVPQDRHPTLPTRTGGLILMEIHNHAYNKYKADQEYNAYKLEHVDVTELFKIDCSTLALDPKGGCFGVTQGGKEGVEGGFKDGTKDPIDQHLDGMLWHPFRKADGFRMDLLKKHEYLIKKVKKIIEPL